MRLIDADALFTNGKYKLTDAVKNGNKDDDQRNWSYSTMMMYEIADEIDNAPTVDVAPVTHGQWIDSKHYCDYTCSVCSGTSTKTTFCCHCGARMDGDRQ